MHNYYFFLVDIAEIFDPNFDYGDYMIAESMGAFNE